MAQSRRSRYTVTFMQPGLSDVQKRVCLAYSAGGARDCYKDRGTVLTVTKGDCRMQARRREATTRRVPFWTFNMPAIREAFEAMTGAPLPDGLTITKGKATMNQRGVFVTNSLTGELVVRVARNLEPEQANRTLWHELAHVAQYVRMGGLQEWTAYCKVANHDGTGYRNRAHEREAREWEALAETDNLLTTGGTR